MVVTEVVVLSVVVCNVVVERGVVEGCLVEGVIIFGVVVDFEEGGNVVVTFSEGTGGLHVTTSVPGGKLKQNGPVGC